MIRPSHFMNGIGCQKCCGHQKTDEEVKEELTKIHTNLDFSITKFSEHDKNYRILVICPKHGIRNLNYYNLRSGKGCDLCKGEKAGLKNRMKYKDFIKKDLCQKHNINLLYFSHENIKFPYKVYTNSNTLLEEIIRN